MNPKIAIAFGILLLSSMARADGPWVLESSTLTYHVAHPLHHVEGISHEARGKGVCQAGSCDFLIAVTVKSFDSGDSNRDLHMIQVVRGGANPMVVVRTKLPEKAAGGPTINMDLEIQFAGETARYSQIPFQLERQGEENIISGTIPAKISDFKIPAPSLLTVPIKNEIPITIDMTWRKS